MMYKMTSIGALGVVCAALLAGCAQRASQSPSANYDISQAKTATITSSASAGKAGVLLENDDIPKSASFESKTKGPMIIREVRVDDKGQTTSGGSPTERVSTHDNAEPRALAIAPNSPTHKPTTYTERPSITKEAKASKESSAEVNHAPLGVRKAPQSSGEYLVQVGAFRSQDGANLRKRAWSDTLKKIANTSALSVIVREFSVDGAPLYRVYIRGFSDREVAGSFRDSHSDIELLKQGFVY